MVEKVDTVINRYLLVDRAAARSVEIPGLVRRALEAIAR
jgi:hypothetical protein